MGRATTMPLAAMPLALAVGFVITLQNAPAEARPAPGRCVAPSPLREGQIARSTAVTVPKPYKKVAKAKNAILAVSTLEGATVCVDMRLKPIVTNFLLSPDQRFFSFSWKGYEAEGHVLIDRAGKGTEMDTGVAPRFSPSRRRFAAVHQSDSAFSKLEGFNVWQVDPAGVRQIALVSNIPQMVDWRVEDWGGEDCVTLSAVPFSRLPDDGDVSKVNRDRYSARPFGGTWRITRYIGKGC